MLCNRWRPIVDVPHVIPGEANLREEEELCFRVNRHRGLGAAREFSLILTSWTWKPLQFVSVSFLHESSLSHCLSGVNGLGPHMFPIPCTWSPLLFLLNRIPPRFPTMPSPAYASSAFGEKEDDTGDSFLCIVRVKAPGGTRVGGKSCGTLNYAILTKTLTIYKPVKKNSDIHLFTLMNI